MSETKQQRQARQQAILDLLNAPGGRERSNADIAAQVGCGPRSVAYVRKQNPTPEELDHTMQVLDAIFPGIHRWYRETQARKAIQTEQKKDLF